MPQRSAAILLYRVAEGGVEVLIAHPGGPFWARKDDGAWSIPKGEYHDGEDPWRAAQREFTEEVGLGPPEGPRVDLGEMRQSGGKIVTGYAVRGDLDISDAHSNTFAVQWPPGSRRVREFPEVDRVAWVPVATARVKLVAGQRAFLDRLLAHLA